MGLDLDFSNAQTPLDEDEREGLLIPTITNRGELDEFEQLGVERANECLLKRKMSIDKTLTQEFVKELHKKMFGDIWEWAGEFRRTNKNLGVDKSLISIELKKLLDDCNYWIDNKIFPDDEITVRLSDRVVSIYPFSNGNGRHSRLLADVLINKGLGKPYFTWGSQNLVYPGEARAKYIEALKEADQNNYSLLIKFSRS